MKFGGGLLSPSPVRYLTDNEEKLVDELIETATENWLDFYDRASESIKSEQYFHSRIHESTFCRTMVKGATTLFGIPRYMQESKLM